MFLCVYSAPLAKLITLSMNSAVTCLYYYDKIYPFIFVLFAYMTVSFKIPQSQKGHVIYNYIPNMQHRLSKYFCMNRNPLCIMEVIFKLIGSIYNVIFNVISSNYTSLLTLNALKLDKI